jgi:hypothetical protein
LPVALELRPAALIAPDEHTVDGAFADAGEELCVDVA